MKAIRSVAKQDFHRHQATTATAPPTAPPPPPTTAQERQPEVDDDNEADLGEEEEISEEGFGFFVNDELREVASHMNCFLLKYG